MMRRLHLLIALATPMLPAAAQTINLDNGTLVVPSGVLDLSGSTLVVGANGTLDENGGRVAGGLLTATRTLNAPAGENVGGLGAVVTSDEDLGETTVTRGHTPQTGEGNTGVARYYDIVPTNNAGLNATIVFRYHPDEIGGLPEAELELYHSTDDGATWTPMYGTVDADAHLITLAGIDGFSRWTAAASSSPLPVELTSFAGLIEGADVVLRWTTASETNNAGFEVQHLSGADWRALGFVAGYGTTIEARAYAYRAAGLPPGTHRFRLRQIDFDGTFAYSPEVEASVGVPGTHLLTEAYPNPFNPQTSFALSVQSPQEVRLAVYDALGRQVALLHDGALDAGTTHRFTFGGSGMPSGVYLLRAEGRTFVETRTLMLVK